MDEYEIIRKIEDLERKIDNLNQSFCFLMKMMEVINRNMVSFNNNLNNIKYNKEDNK